MTRDKLIYTCYLCTKDRIDAFSWDYRLMVRRNCDSCGQFGELVPIEKIHIMGGFTIYAQVKQRMVGFYASRDTALCK